MTSRLHCSIIADFLRQQHLQHARSITVLGHARAAGRDPQNCALTPAAASGYGGKPSRRSAELSATMPFNRGQAYDRPIPIGGWTASRGCEQDTQLEDASPEEA
jgi:hypothetical protein